MTKTIETKANETKRVLTPAEIAKVAGGPRYPVSFC